MQNSYVTNIVSFANWHKILQCLLFYDILFIKKGVMSVNLPISEPFLWLVVIVISLLVEAMTAGLTTIWFSVGAVASLISSYCGINFVWQIIIFIVVSVAALIITRPLVKNKIHKNKIKTNADVVVGKKAIVTESICPIEGKGQVKVDGKIWSAKTETSEEIEKNELVTVEKIEGVHLVVSKGE